MLAHSEALSIEPADAHRSDRLILITDASPALPTPSTSPSTVMHTGSCKCLRHRDSHCPHCLRGDGEAQERSVTGSGWSTSLVRDPRPKPGQ